MGTGASGGIPPAGLSLSGNTLSVDPAHAAFDNLSAGVDRVIVASYNVSDGLDTVGQTLTITITGTNDPPVVQGVIGKPPLAYTENDAATTINSAITLSDVDDTHLDKAI